MKKDLLTRREALRGGLSIAAGAAGLMVLGCDKKELSCTDTAGLSAQELQTRSSLGYVDVTPDPAKPCETCQFYVAAAPDKCGGCSVVKGPIHPRGYCKSWAPKST